MRILVTGVSGQLGSDLLARLSPHFQVYGFNHQEMDVTSIHQVEKIVQQLQPDAIIHTAAYTRVDEAETNVDKAYWVNAWGTRNVTVAAQNIGAKMIYISTDYVFNGCSQSPYHEFAFTNPVNVYGKSKLAGEEFVKSLSDRYFIIRTSWLYGSTGNNFVKTMLRVAQEKEEIFVVDDQFGSPTYTIDLVHFLRDVVTTNCYGIYHASNAGYCSWYEFAKTIFELAKINVRLTAVSSKDFPRTAIRPAFSALDHMAIRLHGFKDLRPWSTALQDFIHGYKKEKY